MGLANTFDAVSRLVERYESDGVEVRSVEAATRDGPAGGLTATLEFPFDPTDATPTAAAVTDDGGVGVEFDAAALPAAPAVEGLRRDGTDARVVDGTVVLTARFVATGEGESGDDADAARGGRDGAAEPGSGSLPAELRAVRDASVPAYEDGPYLRALYDACDTFTEMSDLIEMEVSSETVRRYMIDAGVHEPDRYDTPVAARGDDAGSTGAADPGEAADPDGHSGGTAGRGPRDGAAVTDGVGLPDDVTLPEGVQLCDVVGAVVESTAEYQVQRRLDLGRDETRRLLEELNLLDLLHHRLTDHDRERPSYEEVAARIRQRAPSGA